MGVDIHAARFLLSEHARGTRFARTLTLGHQTVYMPPAEYATLLKSVNVPCSDPSYADDLLRGCGATEVDVMDASSYEGANVLHDLNLPIPEDRKNRYDCVFDGGSLEHVFNFPVALRNCMEMVRAGGHLIVITPMNNYAGHGFYQFSPELFYSALSPANGFEVERMLISHTGRWYAVRAPAEVGERVNVFTTEPSQLFISAKRSESRPVFSRWPQQSDYVAAWTGPENGGATGAVGGGLKEWMIRRFPGLAVMQQKWRFHKHRKKFSLDNPAFFRETKL